MAYFHFYYYYAEATIFPKSPNTEDLKAVVFYASYIGHKFTA